MADEARSGPLSFFGPHDYHRRDRSLGSPIKSFSSPFISCDTLHAYYFRPKPPPGYTRLPQSGIDAHCQTGAPPLTRFPRVGACRAREAAPDRVAAACAIEVMPRRRSHDPCVSTTRPITLPPCFRSSRAAVASAAGLACTGIGGTLPALTKSSSSFRSCSVPT
jgi:putative hemolysin